MRSLFVMLALVAGCRSSGTDYYTLVAPPGDNDPLPTNELQIDVLAVDVPPEVDRAEIVIREGRGKLTPVDTRAWISPLPREVRRAFSNALSRDLGARDIAGVTPTEGVPTYRIKLAVQRFESSLGKLALIEAITTVREAGGATPALVCSHRARETPGAGYDGVAEGHQRAIAEIAKQVAAAVRSIRAGTPACAP